MLPEIARKMQKQYARNPNGPMYNPQPAGGINTHYERDDQMTNKLLRPRYLTGADLVDQFKPCNKRTKQVECSSFIAG